MQSWPLHGSVLEACHLLERRRLVRFQLSVSVYSLSKETWCLLPLGVVGAPHREWSVGRVGSDHGLQRGQACPVEHHRRHLWYLLHQTHTPLSLTHKDTHTHSHTYNTRNTRARTHAHTHTAQTHTHTCTHTQHEQHGSVAIMVFNEGKPVLSGITVDISGTVSYERGTPVHFLMSEPLQMYRGTSLIRNCALP